MKSPLHITLRIEDAGTMLLGWARGTFREAMSVDRWPYDHDPVKPLSYAIAAMMEWEKEEHEGKAPARTHR